MTNLVSGNTSGSMAFTVLRNIHKFTAGHSMFCEQCRTCLDCDDSVSIEWTHTKGTKEGRRVSAIVCGGCWDGKVKANLSAYETESAPINAEFIDGRELA